jgi:hypothetical protein
LYEVIGTGYTSHRSFAKGMTVAISGWKKAVAHTTIIDGIDFFFVAIDGSESTRYVVFIYSGKAF